MIIECQACANRYDIKTAFPADGRTVRCAKCSTVWRAMPNAVAEQAASAVPSAAPEEEKQAPVASVTTSQPEEDAEFSGSPEPSAPPMQFAREDSQPRHCIFRALCARGCCGGSSALKRKGRGRPRGFRFAGRPSGCRRPRNREGELVWKLPPQESADDAEPADRAGPRSVSAETIPSRAPLWLRSGFRLPPGEPLETLEDARAAVRSVFSSLADARPASKGAVSQRRRLKVSRTHKMSRV